MKHFCPKCHLELEKQSGTRGIYQCRKCGFRMNTTRKTELGMRFKKP